MSERQARFRVIFDQTRADVWGYVARRTTDRHEAEDVLSETWAVVWRRLEDAPDDAGTRPWVFTIARNVLANTARAGRRRSRLLERLHGVGPVPVTTGRPSVGDRDGIVTAFGGLRPQDRDLLVMAGADGLDAAEMARVLGCSTATLHVRLHRARRRFRDRLVAEGLADLLPGAPPPRPRNRPTLSSHPEEAR